MPNVIRSPRAREDLLDIWLYIAVDNPNAADKLLDELEDAMWLLAKNKKAGVARNELRKGLRSFVVGEYLIFYRPVSTGIEVARVLRGTMDHKAHLSEDD